MSAVKDRLTAEGLVLYPSPEVRLVKNIVSGSVGTEKTILHRDGLGSVRAVTSAAGLRTETSSYRPFGEQSEAVYALNTAEAKGFIGERFDACSALIARNAVLIPALRRTRRSSGARSRRCSIS